MHELFTLVLTHKDLSKAGDLFNVADHVIVKDLTLVIKKINEIANLTDYTSNDNNQSVVEICITRVISAIRETGSIEEYAEPLVDLLQTCLNHNLRPTTKDQDPPHAKIASDVVSCIFLNYHKREVMGIALPVAVKFLHKGNKELSRNMSSYLSLAAIEAADLLAQHLQPIIDSIISGNYILSRVLPQIYSVKKDPIHNHIMTLVSLLPQCHTNEEKMGLLSLFTQVAKTRPSLLEASLPQLLDCLSNNAIIYATLQIFVQLCNWRPKPFYEHINRLKVIAEQQPNCLTAAIQIIASVGRTNRDKGVAALEYIFGKLSSLDNNNLSIGLREIQLLTFQYPDFVNERTISLINKLTDRANATSRMYINQLNHEFKVSQLDIPKGVTVVAIGGSHVDVTAAHSSRGDLVNGAKETTGSQVVAPTVSKISHKYQKHSDTSRSTGRLLSASNRSMPRLNALPQSTGRLGSSSIQLNKSTSRLNSSHGMIMNRSITVLTPPTRQYSGHLPPVGSHLGGSHLGGSRLVSSQPPQLPLSSGLPSPSSCTASSLPGTISPTKSTSSSVTTLKDGVEHGSSGGHAFNNSQTALLHQDSQHTSGTALNNNNNTTPTNPSSYTLSLALRMSSKELAVSQSSGVSSSARQSHSPLSQCASIQPTLPVQSMAGAVSSNAMNSTMSASTIPRSSKANTTLTQITADHISCSGNTQRISVFEPIAMRDTVQHFCEKHLDKIKAYMQKVFVKLPIPVRCGIVEQKSRKHAILYYTCQGKGEHCLYSKHFFTMKTRNPRIWIHLMFLRLQARSAVALSTREPQVSSLKNCWDTLRCDNKTFITLVTSAFPSAKDMDMLMHELRNARFFDVFEYNGVEVQWGCFLCNHPDRARGFVEEDTPVIEGQLKEKKSKWKIFRKWRTRYFTLSGAHLSYRGSTEDKVDEKGGIDVHQIRSVKVNRSAGRNIPKAFEIFTDNKSFVLKAKDSSNAEEWVRCLSIVVAHSHSRQTQSHHHSHSKMMTTSIPRNFMYGHHSSVTSSAASTLVSASRTPL